MLGELCCIWRGAETPGRRIPTHCSGDIEKSDSGLIGVWPECYWAPSRSGLSDLGVSIAPGRLNARLRPGTASYTAPLFDRHAAIVETPGRLVECLVADGSVAAGATTSRVLMIAVRRPGISGFAHFVENVKKSLAVFQGIPDGPGAIGVLNNPTGRCRPEGVFDKHAVGGHLSNLALMRTGAGAVA
jgi:hypothetical protein